MFIGQYQHSIDPKGRLAVPARYRAQLASGAVMTTGMEGCLFLFTPQVWGELQEKARSQPLTSEKARGFARVFFGNASEAELDGQGRVMIPARLREHADLRGSAVVVGVNDRVEIWAEDRWSSFSSRAESEYGALAEELAGFGF